MSNKELPEISFPRIVFTARVRGNSCASCNGLEQGFLMGNRAHCWPFNIMLDENTDRTGYERCAECKNREISPV